jgi:hypothetical protein
MLRFIFSKRFVNALRQRLLESFDICSPATASHVRGTNANTETILVRRKSWKLLEMHVGAPSQNALGTQVLARHPLDECL